MKRSSLFSLRRITKLFYAMGVMMLVFGMLLSAVSVPVYAQGPDDPIETEVVETEVVETEPVETETSTPEPGDGEGEDGSGEGEEGPGEGNGEENPGDGEVQDGAGEGEDGAGEGEGTPGEGEGTGDGEGEEGAGEGDGQDGSGEGDDGSGEGEDGSGEGDDGSGEGEEGSGEGDGNEGSGEEGLLTQEGLLHQGPGGDEGANLTCSELGYDYQIKFDSGDLKRNQWVQKSSGGITVNLFISQNGKTASFTATWPGIDAAVVKGGPEPKPYYFNPKATEGSGLVSNKNNGGKIPEISNIRFCWDDPDPTPTPPAESISIEYICGFPGDSKYEWQITNNTTSDRLQWRVKGETSWNSITVGIGATTTIETSSYNGKKVTFEVRKKNGSKTYELKDGGPCKEALVLSKDCGASGEVGAIDWSVTNPNSASVEITYKLQERRSSDWHTIDSGNASIAGDPFVLSSTLSGRDQRLVVEYGYSEKSLKIDKDYWDDHCAPPPPPKYDLTPICGFPGDNHYYWNFTNNGYLITDFVWGAYKGFTLVDSGSISVGFGETKQIKSTSAGGSGIKLVVAWKYLPLTPLASADSLPPCKANLVPDVTCNTTTPGGGVDWTITNPNDYELNFTYTVTGGATQSGSGNVPANGSFPISTLLTTEAQNLKVEWTDGIWNRSEEKSADGDFMASCIADQPTDVSLSPVCGYPNEDLTWVFTNNSSWANQFVWKIRGTDVQGELTVYKGQQTTFTTPWSDEAVTVDIYRKGGSDVLAFATSAEPCKFDLEISTACDEDDQIYGGVDWTITNPNEYGVEVTYSVTGGDTESDTVNLGTGESTTITTKLTDTAQTLKAEWNDGSQDREVSDEITVDEMNACKPGKPQLGLEYICGYAEEFGEVENHWRVTNPNPFPVTFSWKLAGTDHRDQKTIGANGEMVIKTAPGEQTMQLLSVWDETIAEQYITEEDTCLSYLEPKWNCNEDGPGVDWGVFNPNLDLEVQFAYKLIDAEGNESPSTRGVVGGGETKFLRMNPSLDDQSLTLTWTTEYWGVRSVTESATDEELAVCQPVPPVRPNISMEFVCGYEEEFDTVNYKWLVTNHDEDDVDFEWLVLNGDEGGVVLTSTAVESGSGTVPGGKSVIFETSWGEKIVRLSAIVDEEPIVIDEMTSGQACKSYLDPQWTCNEQQEGGVDWSVSNPNDFGITFDYTLNNGDPVLGETIEKESTKSLFTAFLDTQNLKIDWVDLIWGAKSVDASADVETCKDDPEPTPTVPGTTPTVPGTTPTVPVTTPSVPGTTPTEPESTQTVLVPVTASTPMPTLAAPEVVADPEIIPVTGVDLTNAPFGIPALAILKGLLINLGLALLGLGLVSQGLVGYLSKR